MSRMRSVFLAISRAALWIFDAICIGAETALPFDVLVPNAETQAAIRNARTGNVTRYETVAALMEDLGLKRA